jgi:radical SAM protein
MFAPAAWEANRFSVPRSRDFSRSPLIVFYEITRACDLCCLHCRACAQPRPHPGELTPAESRRLVDQVADFPDPPMLVLTGGDPLKRADVFDLIEHARRSGLEVAITPSATPLVTAEAIGRLREAGISRIAVSLDGADAATHDAVRGVAGSFQRTLAILREVRAAGVPAQVNTTITPFNAGQIDAMAALLGREGIVMWSVFFLVPVGRAEAMPRLTAEECEEAFERLWAQSQRQPYLIKTTEAPHFRRYVLRKQMEEAEATGGRRISTRAVTHAVNDGKGVMFVGHTGLIQPSGFMPIVCGLFPLDHLVHVYQASPVFRALRDAERLEGKCRVCEFRNICGGSRARAYAVTGNPLAQEPDCSYVPQALAERSQ